MIGIPGSGKSVLAASLIWRLKREEVPVLYFFFRQIVDANHDPQSALRDWLTQLLQFSPPLQNDLKEYLESPKGSENPLNSKEYRKLESLSQFDLWRHLRNGLAHLPRAYIVVDALDEANTGPETETFLQELAELAKWKPSQTKVLVTSRPLATIERALRMQRMLHARLDGKKVDCDIAIYVETRLHASSIPSEYHEPIKAAVPGKANGLFLFAKLAMDGFCEKDAKVKDVLRDLPANLEVMYTQLLREHTRKTGLSLETQLLIMQLITHATRPLRLLELADAMATTRSSEITDLKVAKELIRSACGSLLEILPDETICVVHHSLTEFLNGSARSNLHDYPVLEAGSTHTRLAIMCLLYLQSGCLEPISVEDSEESRLYRQLAKVNRDRRLLAPFAKYAARNWYIHARKASLCGADQSKLHEILDNFTVHSDFRKWAILAKLPHLETGTSLLMAVSLGLGQYMRRVVSQSIVSVEEGAPICYAAEKGFADAVRLLLENGAPPHQFNSQGLTALHLASKNNHSEVVSALLKSGCDYTIRTKITRTFDGNMSPEPQHTALWYACTYGHVATVAEFLPYIQTTDQVNSALSCAVAGRKSEVVEIILKHPKVDVNADKRRPVLHAACSNRDLQTIKLLLDAGADPNLLEIDPGRAWIQKNGDRGVSPLHALAKRDHYSRSRNEQITVEDLEACFTLLLNAGAKVNQLDIDGRTPLHGASDSTSARMLMAAGADVDAISEREGTPLHTCTEDGVLRALVELGNADTAKCKYEGLTPLLHALMDGYPSMPVEKVFTLLKLGASAAVVDHKGNGAVHFAVQKRNIKTDLPELVRRLCQAGADINLVNNEGWAPIHLAKIDLRDKNSAFRVLVDAGAAINPTDERSKNATFKWIAESIFSAGEQGLDEVVQTLITFGADLKCTDDRGRSLLHEACNTKYGWGEVAHLRNLVDKGLDPLATDDEGNTLWHEIVPRLTKYTYDPGEHGLRIPEELLKMGVPPQRANKRGRTPLHILASIEPEDIRKNRSSWSGGLGKGHAGKIIAMDLLLENEVAIDCKDEDGITPLHLASTFSEFLTRKLLDAGADPLHATKDGSIALHISARSRVPNVVGIILELLKTSSAHRILDAVNYQDKEGRTPLFYACASGSFESATLLVQAGAETDFEDYQSSPWLALVGYEREMEKWTSFYSRYDQVEDAGGVLITDSLRAAMDRNRNPHFDRIDELTELLLTCGKYRLRWLDQAINDAADRKADLVVDCLLRARASLFPGEKVVLTPSIEKSIRRTAEKRNPRREPCANCNKVHAPASILDQILMIKDPQLLPEPMSSEQRLEIRKDGGDKNERTMLHYLVSKGLASLLSHILTPEDLRTLDDRAWCEKQEKLAHLKPGAIQPLLLQACRRTDPNMDVIRLLVEQFNVNINAQHNGQQQSYSNGHYGDTECESALHVVSQGQHWWQVAEALPYLLHHGANTELRDAKSRTPLNAALDKTGWIEFNKKSVKLLVQHGADVNAVDGEGNSALAKALFDMEMTQLLLDNGAQVTYDVLRQVIRLRSLELLKLFLSRGANPNVRGVSRYRKGQQPVAPQLDGGSYDPNPHEIYHDEMYPLHLLMSNIQRQHSAADKTIDEQMVQLLLSDNANPFAEYADAGTTILHDLIREGINVNILLTRSIPSTNLEKRNWASDTPLLQACHPSAVRGTSRDDAIQLLVLRGADVRAEDRMGRNALHHLYGSCGSAMQLILSKAPELVNRQDNSGNTPLHAAMRRPKSHAKQIDMFLAAGGDIHCANGKGDTMLHLLLRGTWDIDSSGRVESTSPVHNLFHHLLSQGANLNAPNNRGETPIFSFFRHGSVEEPRAAPELQFRVPHRQTSVREEAVYEILNKTDVDWNIVNKKGQNLLHAVAGVDLTYPKGRAVKRFKMLVDLGLDPGLEDCEQRTPVDIAAELGNEEVLELFRGVGDQRTPVDIATELGNEELLELV